ncbi:MAG TPA: aminotransferase class I/II-fold pyridoxal phosphate-dependent enzyme [Alphaproteobacteria bacterium]|nr:aminotransferase class I/II-fold pyridoxal phosphate-dependent enzyme [Alphaproteobacteria bacterium]
MLNDRFANLPEYMFPRYRALIAGMSAPATLTVINMTVGEPRHKVPGFVGDILKQRDADYGKYPPIQGTEEWQEAVTGWLTRRFRLAPGQITAENVLPLVGTREGLFLATLAVTPSEKAGQRPAVVMPNPFYQCYLAAALAAHADPILLHATAETGFLPDFASLSAADTARTSVFYLCSPANPQGSVADLAYLTDAIERARAVDGVLVMDECYSEIYEHDAPPGALQAAAALPNDLGDPFANVLVFHSLSKRSNLPGLRSGFVAGDRRVIAAFRRLRALAGPTSPIPVLAAAAQAWRDETHVEESRQLYRRKFELAEAILTGKAGYHRPRGGFYLWLDVGDGEAFATRLWQEQGVMVLPGAYIGETDAAGFNPGRPYVRVALVDPPDVVGEALNRIAKLL